MPKSTGPARDRERHCEAVARTFEVRAAYVCGNAIAGSLDARQRGRTRGTPGAAKPSYFEQFLARAEKRRLAMALIGERRRGGTISGAAVRPRVCRGKLPPRLTTM